MDSPLPSARATFGPSSSVASQRLSRPTALCAVEHLRGRAPAVLPSLLMCDFGHLADEVARLEEAGVPALHLDVMDGHFVPNLTYGLPLVEALRRLTDLPLDAHLMIERPERWVEAFVAAGADLVTIHAEAVDDPRPVLEKIRDSGAGAGLAINPPTPVAQIADSVELCDLILVMSVMPGFGGQAFQSVALEKLRTLRAAGPSRLLLEIDGGVNDTTIGQCSEAGADLFVVGSALFRHADYPARVRALSGLIHARTSGH